MKNYKSKNVKVSDKYWKTNLMKILEVFEHHELTWNRDLWHEHGISNSDKKKIEQAYENYQRQSKKTDSCECNNYCNSEEVNKNLNNLNK